MKDPSDVQLGVARPVEVAPPPGPQVEARPPIVVVEYRNRGIPLYLVPPFLILLAAVGIMAYQQLTPNPLPRRAVQAQVPAVRPVETEPAFEPVVAQAETPPLPRNPHRVEIVETSAEKPVPAPAAKRKPIVTVRDLFDIDPDDGLVPVSQTVTDEPPLRP